jgi:hypothetical protein
VDFKANAVASAVKITLHPSINGAGFEIAVFFLSRE